LKPVIYKWSVTQSLSFREQLEAGIRYFDLRVAVRQSTRQFHFLHTLFGGRVDDGLQEIKTFLDTHAKEIVVLDFNHFYDMTEDNHRDFVARVLSIFGDKVCMLVGLENISLNMMWENGLQVVIVYHNEVWKLSYLL